jgi:hypothetical protein
VSWSSQSVVSLSAIEAEYIATVEALTVFGPLHSKIYKKANTKHNHDHEVSSESFQVVMSA